VKSAWGPPAEFWEPKVLEPVPVPVPVLEPEPKELELDVVVGE
jgi:hypothetical protein